MKVKVYSAQNKPVQLRFSVIVTRREKHFVGTYFQAYVSSSVFMLHQPRVSLGCDNRCTPFLLT
jgi:hypothetical protein